MSSLVVVTYPDEHRAAEVMATLQRLHGEYLIDLADGCVVTKDKRGHIKLHQTQHLSAEGAKAGTAWGALIGGLFALPFIFVPGVGALAMVAATTGVGAASGAIAGHFADIGIDDKFMKELSAQMPPSSSAVFVLVKAAKVEEVLPEVAKYGGTVLHTNLAPDAEQKLQDALAKAVEGGPASSSGPASS
jgi:uncharacterized membrane protein